MMARSRMADPGRRLPLSSLTAAYVNSLPSVAGLAIAAVLYTVRPQLWPGVWALPVIAVLLLVRVVHPLLRWATLRYEVTPRHLRLTTGVLVRRSRSSNWTRLTVVDTETPWAYRLFRLSIVTVRSGGDDDTVLTLPGIRFADAGHLAALASATEDRVLERDTDSGHVADEGELAYRARAAELIFASFAYGQFLVVGAGVAGGLVDALDTIGALDGALTAFQAAPVVVAVGAAIVIAIVGLGLTLVRYHGFEVRRHSGGYRIRYGLLSRRDREIAREAVLGVQAQRNLAEMLFDRVRVSLLTTDSAGQVGSNLVLPSLPRATASAFVASALPHLQPVGILNTSGRGSVGRTVLTGLAVLIAPAIILISTWQAGLPRGFALAGGALALVLGATAARHLFARLSFDGVRVTLATHHLVQRQEVLALDAVHLVSAWSLGRGARRIVRTHYFAGRPRALTTLHDIGAGERIAAALPPASASALAARIHPRERLSQ